MAIVKRLTPEERFEQRYGKTWKRIRNLPIVRALWNPDFVNPIDVSPVNFSKMLDSFTTARWISEVPFDTKIFFYVLELVAERAGVPGFLPEGFLAQLNRHLAALTTADKMNAGDGVSLAFRQCYLWDIPRFKRDYPRPGTLHLPSPVKPLKKAKIPLKKPATATPSPVRKRLAKHKK